MQLLTGELDADVCPRLHGFCCPSKGLPPGPPGVQDAEGGRVGKTGAMGTFIAEAQVHQVGVASLTAHCDNTRETTEGRNRVHDTCGYT